MAKINWTFQALEDLNEIAEYLSNSSPKYANYIVDEIFKKVEMLENFPYTGRVVPETNIASIRELIVKKYRVIYSIPNRDEVSILTVHPSALPLSDIPTS